MTAANPRSSPHDPRGRVRLDKWLWAARFYKTRGLAAEVIDKGRVHVNGQSAKCSRELHVGDRIELRPELRGEPTREVCVTALSDRRGPASVARTLYAETPQSIAAREAAIRARPYVADPALSIEQGRPTKRNRRELVAWQRWGASIDE
ncbi:MAG TPA: RNA-binding S4 domain-containing protein [Burkholderiaceae bacterium]|nr:RNA-binding S4 domain-containing protein [Burkholderiaceae bacterium]